VNSSIRDGRSATPRYQQANIAICEGQLDANQTMRVTI
jgi:hypothetical protein